MRGAIAFTSHKTSWISKAIRWFTKSKFSHSLIIVDEVGENRYLLEAGTKEVSFDLFDKYEKKQSSYEIWIPKGVTEEEIERALKKTQKEFVHKTYGYLQLIGFAMKIGLQKIGIQINNPIKLGSICSEVDWYYLKELMPHIFKKYDRDSVSPKDLRDIILKHPISFELIEKKEY